MQFEKDTVDRRVERCQLEGLSEDRRFHSLEEKLDRRIVLVAGKKNEPRGSRRPDPRYRPIEHLAPDVRHQHVANDEIKSAVHDLAQALHAARDGDDLKRAEGQVVAENLPEIITIFQEQNSPGRAHERRHFVVNVDSDDVLGIGNLRTPAHRPKPISKTGALGTECESEATPIALIALLRRLFRRYGIRSSRLDHSPLANGRANICLVYRLPFLRPGCLRRDSDPD